MAGRATVAKRSCFQLSYPVKVAAAVIASGATAVVGVTVVVDVTGVTGVVVGVTGCAGAVMLNGTES